MLKKKLFLSIFLLSTAFIFMGSAMAATSVSWLTPPDGSSFVAGTTQTVTGQASGVGQTGGSGLDLVLVMDSSGSMRGDGQTAQRTAALGLVAALPQGSTSVAVVDFDHVASTSIGLTALDGSNTAVNAAITAINASGGTAIHAGVNQAATVLATATDANRLQAMVVMSDGGSTINLAETAADTAMALSYVDAIHSVGMGANFSAGALQAVVNGVDDVYNNADDYGSFVGAAFTDLLGIFTGTSGNLVGLDYIDITLPDSTVLSDWATDGLGNFTLDYTLALGANVFSVTAYGDDGTSATAEWTLYGVDGGNPVPEPATMVLFGLGLLGLAGISRKK